MVRLRGNTTPASQPEDFITGFIENGKVHGRPVDIFSFGKDAFLITDDYAGAIYYIYEK